jgi:hypothetical protein
MLRRALTYPPSGEVLRYQAHEQYYRREIVPRLGGLHRFISAVGFVRKRRLLSAAQCLLAPCPAAETSSLGAMKAMACGMPVGERVVGAVQHPDGAHAPRPAA